MSEIINNREYRQRVLKDLIKELHEGKSVEETRERFAKLIEGVAASEISEMEQSLIMEGMPIQEVQRLCDVHAAVFKGSIQEIHHPDEIPGHPVHTFKLENRALEKLIDENIHNHIQEFKENDSKENILKLIEDFNSLLDIDKHYSRKENILFPYLEKYEITGPPKVMWGVDDEIRDEIKNVKNLLLTYSANKEEVISKITEVSSRIKDMIFKEENILFPMAIDTLTQDEWVGIMNQSYGIGYCLVDPQGKWNPKRVEVEEIEEKENNKIGDENSKGYIKFETGILKVEEIAAIFNYLPIDITFIDKDNIVKFFNQSDERIFVRTKAVIGRTVQNCHPPASVHIVNKMVEDFRNGVKDHEDFWIKMGEKYIYIRYFAVRNERGEYMGTLEVTQNIKGIQGITGEKRLVKD